MTEAQRYKQKQMDYDNASMVRRILSVQSTFDPVHDARTYKRHSRAVSNLQRFPEGGLKNPWSLPPLGRNRPMSHTTPARGLEALMLPGDLHRSQSGPGAVGRQTSIETGPNPAHATTAPPGSLPDTRRDGDATTSSDGALLGSQTYSLGGFDTYDSFASESQKLSASGNKGALRGGREDSSREPSGGLSQTSGEPSAGPSQSTLPRPAVGPGPQEEAASAAGGASAFSNQDGETERRQWQEGAGKGTAEEPAGADNVQSTTSLASGGPMGLTGMSNGSEQQYADDWDESSLNSSGTVDASQSAAPSRGPSGMGTSLKTTPEDQLLESNDPAAGSATGARAEASVADASAAPDATPPAEEDHSVAPDFSKKKKRPR